MKKDIHPSYNEVTITWSNGDKFVTRSTYNGKEILSDVDYRKHPAWVGGVAQNVNASAAAVASFHGKYGNMFSSPVKNDTSSDKKEDSEDKKN